MRDLGLVFLNNVADFIEQWMQILFVLLPAPGCRGRVDRLAHLRGACRTYRPVGIVEIETAFVPFETEIGDQFLGLPLDIGNIVHVPDLEHPIRDRTRVEEGKSVSVRVELGGRRIIKKKKKTK